MRKVIRGIGYAFALTLVLALINFLPVTSLRTRDMQKYTIDGITVFAEQKDFTNAQRIVSTIHKSSQRIHDALGIQEDQHIDLYIYPDRKALHRKTIGFAGWFLPDWYIGRNSSGSVFITSPSEPGPEHSRESIEKAAVHEYVHAMTDRQNTHMGYWMKEAFALYLADQEPSLASLRANSHITFAEFKTRNPLEFANVGGYSLSFNYMQFLIEEFGWQKVLGFLNPEKTFEDITGRNEEAVFHQWKLSLSSI